MTIVGDFTSPRKLTIVPGNVQISNIVTPDGEQSDEVTITYTLQSDQSETASIVPTFSTDGSDPTTTANEGSGGDGLTGLATSPDGVVHTFIWNSLHATEGITSIAREVGVLFKIIPKDASGDAGAGMTTNEFLVDNLPIMPTYISDSFIDDFKTEDTTPTFIWEIPTDPGTDNIDGQIQWADDIIFTTNLVTKSSDNDTDNPYWADPPGVKTFEYNVTTNTNKTFGDYYVSNLSVTSESGTAFTFDDLIDTITGTDIPTTLTSPQIMISPKNGRPVYLTAKSNTGFTLAKAQLGDDSDAVVDVWIFDGATSWDEYWEEGIAVSSKSLTTILFSSLGNDINGTAIPSSITNPVIAVMNRKDRIVIVENITNNGFDVRKAALGGDSDGLINVMILKDSTDVYNDRDVTVSSETVASSTTWDNRTDDTDGGGAFPSILFGAQCILLQKKDRQVIAPIISDYGHRFKKSQSGSDVDGVADVIVFSAPAAAGSWSPVPLEGVDDQFSGEKMKYTVPAGDVLSQGTFFWRIAGGN